MPQLRGARQEGVAPGRRAFLVRPAAASPLPRAGAVRHGPGVADPLGDAQALLVVLRVLVRVRAKRALRGSRSAAGEVRALVNVGKTVRAAVDDARRAAPGSAEQLAALERVLVAGNEARGELAGDGSAAELVGELLEGVRAARSAPSGAAPGR